jgi:hypothetical protein
LAKNCVKDKYVPKMSPIKSSRYFCSFLWLWFWFKLGKELCYQEQIYKEKCSIKICSFCRLLLEFLLYYCIDYYYYYYLF